MTGEPALLEHCEDERAEEQEDLKGERVGALRVISRHLRSKNEGGKFISFVTVGSVRMAGLVYLCLSPHLLFLRKSRGKLPKC